MPNGHPVQVDVEYPDRPLNRLTTALRIFTIIPIAIVLGTVSGETWGSFGGHGTSQTTRTVVVQTLALMIRCMDWVEVPRDRARAAQRLTLTIVPRDCSRHGSAR